MEEMAKLLKIFSSSEKRAAKTEEDDKTDFTPPFDERRKLSISRSGKMKQANKTRNTLSKDLYGQDNFQTVQKPKSQEYHVNNQFKDQKTKKTADDKIDKVSDDSKKDNNTKELTPEEQIESAFNIIDKVS